MIRSAALLATIAAVILIPEARYIAVAALAWWACYCVVA